MMIDNSTLLIAILLYLYTNYTFLINFLTRTHVSYSLNECDVEMQFSYFMCQMLTNCALILCCVRDSLKLDAFISIGYLFYEHCSFSLVFISVW